MWRMRIAGWMLKATNTQTGYVILIAHPLQQRMYKHASILHYTHTAVGINFCNTKPAVVQLLVLVKLKQTNWIKVFLKPLNVYL